MEKPERQFAAARSGPGDGFGQIQRARGVADQRIGLGVLQQPQLPEGVAAGGRQYGRPDPFNAAVKAESFGQRPVTEGDLDQLVCSETA